MTWRKSSLWDLSRKFISNISFIALHNAKQHCKTRKSELYTSVDALSICISIRLLHCFEKHICSELTGLSRPISLWPLRLLQIQLNFWTSDMIWVNSSALSLKEIHFNHLITAKEAKGSALIHIYLLVSNKIQYISYLYPIKTLTIELNCFLSILRHKQHIFENVLKNFFKKSAQSSVFKHMNTKQKGP